MKKTSIFASLTSVVLVLLNSFTLTGIDFLNATAPILIVIIFNFAHEAVNRKSFNLMTKIASEERITYIENLKIKELRISTLLDHIELQDKRIDVLFKDITEN